MASIDATTLSRAEKIPGSAAKIGKLNSIQHLRAAAALLVLLSHIAKELSSSQGIRSITLEYFSLYGQFGVDIFFVISGFVMVYISAGKSATETSGGIFFKKRIARVVPLYWIGTTMALAAAIATDLKNHSETGIGYVVSSYLFIPWPREDGHMTPVLGVGWTLNYEMFFYALFAMGLMLPRRMTMSTVLCILVLLVAVGSIIDPTQPQLMFWTRSILLEFALGMGLALVYLRGWQIGAVLSALIIIVGATLWIGLPATTGADPIESNNRLILWGIPAALIVTGFVLSPHASGGLLSGAAERLVRNIGDASYSLYLFHMFFVRILTLIFPFNWFGTQSATIYIISAIALTVVASILVHLHVEVFLNRYFARFSR